MEPPGARAAYHDPSSLTVSEIRLGCVGGRTLQHRRRALTFPKGCSLPDGHVMLTVFRGIANELAAGLLETAYAFTGQGDQKTCEIPTGSEASAELGDARADGGGRDGARDPENRRAAGARERGSPRPLRRLARRVPSGASQVPRNNSRRR